MKTVFTNSLVAHVWAQQNQSLGRNASNTFFFRDSSIWSYGSHYLAAKIHLSKNGRTQYALINDHNYSISTCKHLNAIRSALRGKMDYFHVDDPANIQSALKYLDTQAQKMIEQALGIKRIRSKSDINTQFSIINEAFKQASQFRALIGKPEKWPSKAQLAKVKKYLGARLDRFHELNTPEMIAKKDAAKLKRDLASRKKNEAKLAQAVDDFRRFKNTRVFGGTLEYDILRVQTAITTGEQWVFTSRGAQAPLAPAVKLLKAILKDENLPKETRKIGAFSLDAIEHAESIDDSVLHIGCHRILLSEAKEVLKDYL